MPPGQQLDGHRIWMEYVLGSADDNFVPCWQLISGAPGGQGARRGGAGGHVQGVHRRRLQALPGAERSETESSTGHKCQQP